MTLGYTTVYGWFRMGAASRFGWLSGLRPEVFRPRSRQALGHGPGARLSARSRRSGPAVRRPAAGGRPPGPPTGRTADASVRRR